MQRHIFRILCAFWLVCAVAQAQGPLRLVVTSPLATLDQSGAGVQLRAYQMFLRGNVLRTDVTSNVVWSSSDSSIASVDSNGLLAPVSEQL